MRLLTKKAEQYQYKLKMEQQETYVCYSMLSIGGLKCSVPYQSAVVEM